MSANETVEMLKAIAHPVRFRVLEALRASELSVGEIEEATGIAQPGLSQQLAVLRKAGLVETRRQAKLVFYSLDTQATGKVVDSLAGLARPARHSDSAPRRSIAGAAHFARVRLTG